MNIMTFGRAFKNTFFVILSINIIVGIVAVSAYVIKDFKQSQEREQWYAEYNSEHADEIKAAKEKFEFDQRNILAYSQWENSPEGIASIARHDSIQAFENRDREIRDSINCSLQKSKAKEERAYLLLTRKKEHEQWRNAHAKYFFTKGWGDVTYPGDYDVTEWCYNKYNVGDTLESTQLSTGEWLRVVVKSKRMEIPD